MSYEQIAAEVEVGLIEAAESTGKGRFYCVLRRNDPAAITASDPIEAEQITTIEPIYFEVTAIETKKEVRDRSGTLTGLSMRVLLVSATGTTPLKSDTIAINIREADIVDSTVFEEIEKVVSISPAGGSVLHKLTMKD